MYPYSARHRLVTLICVATLVCAAACTHPSAEEGTALQLEPLGYAGANPFAPPAGADNAPVAPPAGTGGTFSGATAGLYGGTEDVSSCDAGAMVAFLAANPDKAAAWAGVLGLTPAAIPAYVAALTPAVLRSDTLVTNHGFTAGRATIVPAVLQAGTAVLLDRYGFPVTKCFCGNPLTRPARYDRVRYVGTTWVWFSSVSLTIIDPSVTVINTFTLVEPATGASFTRPTGTSGNQDRQATPPTANAAPPTAPAPATPAPAAPSANAAAPSANPSPSPATAAPPGANRAAPRPGTPTPAPSTVTPTAPALGTTPPAAPTGTGPPPVSAPESSAGATPAEAPATEPPLAAPATEPPVAAPTEAPVTEPPLAPATEAPATEAPATEAPATAAPATEAPEVASASVAVGNCYGGSGSLTGTVLVRNNGTAAHTYDVTVLFGGYGEGSATVSAAGGSTGEAEASGSADGDVPPGTIPCTITSIVDEEGTEPVPGAPLAPPADNPPVEEPSPEES